MKRMIITLVFLGLSAFLLSFTIFRITNKESGPSALPVIYHMSLHNGATCTGAKRCNACKNCKYCKHCAKEGGAPAEFANR